jgi:hypothetical protein
MNPKLTVLLPAMRGSASVAAAIDAWKAQTMRAHLELLVLLPGAPDTHGTPTDAWDAHCAPVWVGGASLHEARAVGVARARGGHVFFAEDHCLPDPDWAEAVLGRIDEGWDVINPAFRPGSRDSLWGLGSFLLGYGEWMLPVRSGPLRIVCGANQIVRTALLRDMEGRLADNLQFGAFLARRLVRQHRRCYLEAEARMRHFDNTLPSRSLKEVLHVGMAFGAFRTEQWRWPARVAYPLALPFLAVLHGSRAWRQYTRAGRAERIPPTVFLAVACQSVAWALGESVGAWIGRHRVIPFLWVAEVKPVTRAAVARSDALEARLRAMTS